MSSLDHVLIRVHDQWDGWHNAEVRLSDLQKVHWLRPARAPRPLLHGYVSCASIAAGEIPHNCQQSAGPHTLLVCVLKKHSTPALYAEMARRAARAPSAPDARSILVDDRSENKQEPHEPGHEVKMTRLVRRL
jgi:hypothetical protein